MRQEAKALDRFGLLGFWIGMMVVGGVPSAYNPLSFLTFNLTFRFSHEQTEKSRNPHCGWIGSMP